MMGAAGARAQLRHLRPVAQGRGDRRAGRADGRDAAARADLPRGRPPARTAAANSVATCAWTCC
ncbi:hypothetical protein AB5I41_28085 [Sphingomonas sp. MMS24-JH45]